MLRDCVQTFDKLVNTVLIPVSERISEQIGDDDNYHTFNITYRGRFNQLCFEIEHENGILLNRCHRLELYFDDFTDWLSPNASLHNIDCYQYINNQLQRQYTIVIDELYYTIDKFFKVV